MENNDAQLIEEYLSGDERALAFIIERYTSQIYNFVFRFTKNTDDTEEITQVVFVKAWKNLKKFDLEKSFKTWLFTIARNTVVDWLRKKKNIVFSRLDTETESFEETLEDPLPLADTLFERKNLQAELAEALDAIPADYKTIILLHHQDDLTFQEIAEVVNKPLNTVKSQYRRGLLQLRGYLNTFLHQN